MLNKIIKYFILTVAVMSLGIKISQAQEMPPPPVESPASDTGSATNSDFQNAEVLPSPSSGQGFFLDDNEKFIFDPTLKRDPFQIIGISDIIKKAESKGSVGAEAIVITDPLQKTDLNDFKVIGIMWEGQKPKAIIQDKSNRNHLIFTGTRIGNKNGYVAMIREGQIVVMEYVDEEGKVVKKPRTLEIVRSR